MEPENLLRRLHELEVEVAQLKAQVARTPRRQVQVVVKKSVGFVLTYWTLLSFVVALGVAIYIKYTFNVDYFESYRAVAASRNMADFHNQFGEDLLRRQEWSAAEEAFTRALAANANHTDAGYGLLKSRIFKPPAGEKFISPRTQDTMLAFLRTQRPGDPDLDFLQAVRHWEQDQKEETRRALEAALAKKPDFSAAQSFLSYIEMVAGNIPAAKAWCEKALVSDPNDATALSNLGFMGVLTGDFDDAIAKLERANFAEPNLLTPLGLADALRLKGEFARALRFTRSSVRSAENADLRASRFVGGEWYYHHLPEKPGDNESSKAGIYAPGMDRKEGICQFSFALDLALTGDTAGAEKPFARAMELMPDDAVRAWCANKIKATAGWTQLSAEAPAAAWLAEKYRALTAGEK